nr:MAG TPA: hypothetical protein [Caudoviricetes sp.]DAZ42225.1 MAG TPA: hypothetical protein [Caudoviricetes sp.]DAZ61362.1 MAG TPA: hypothetical protein [Caudoviricetes sp.]
MIDNILFSVRIAIYWFILYMSTLEMFFSC